METSSKNKVIAKNTVILFFRMIFMMIVSLYTSRVVLNNLGVDDFGINNVVGGLVAVLAILNGSLTNACSRFVTFYLGKNKEEDLRRLFGSSKFLFIIMAILIVVLGETLGSWFLYNKMVIPPDRINAATWVFQCSLFTTVLSVLSVPYISVIQAYERMNSYAYITIIDVSLKLFVGVYIGYVNYDGLIIFAILSLLSSAIIFSIYSIYCHKNFKVCRGRYDIDKTIIFEISKYAGWTLVGFTAIICYTQGLNILLNIFYYPAINAARGIAVQVQSATQTLVENFLLAMKPQIIKSFAQNNLEYMHQLIIASSKFGFYLIMLICFPLSLFLREILSIWLVNVPLYTDVFIRIFLFIAVLQPYRIAMLNGIHATGDIKKFQIYEGGVLLLILHISWLALKYYNISPAIVFIVHLCLEIIAQVVRFVIVLPKVGLNFYYYIKRAVFPTAPFSLFLFAYVFFPQTSNIGILNIILFSFIADTLLSFMFFTFGFTGKEREMVVQYSKRFLKK